MDLSEIGRRVAWRVASGVGGGEQRWSQRRCELLVEWRRRALVSGGGDLWRAAKAISGERQRRSAGEWWRRAVGGEQCGGL